MDVQNLSITFITHKMDECKEFYQKFFNSKVTFDCGWYFTIMLLNTDSKVNISFMNPDNNYTTYPGSHTVVSGGVTLNLTVENPEKEYEKYKESGLEIIQHLGDSPWGDQAFVAKDPIGNNLYIFKWIKPAEEFADSYIDKSAYSEYGIFDEKQ